MNVVMLGPQGSGKGTQAMLIAEKYHIPHISTGNMFRDQASKKTTLGKKLKGYMDKGVLVPDRIVIEIVKGRLSKNDCKNGFVLDGYPRTVNQAKSLDKIAKIDHALYIDISDETAVERLSNRRQCRRCGAIYNLLFAQPEEFGKCDKCGGHLYQRDDDKPNAVRQRLKEFHLKTKPLINYYEKRHVLYKINGEQPIDRVFGDISKVLNKPDDEGKRFGKF